MGNMDADNRKQIVSGIAWSYAERFSAQVVSLVVSIILARLLDPKHYGILAIVSVFITIADALISGGFGNALVQKKDTNPVDFNSIFWLSMIMASVLYGLLFVAAPEIARFYVMDQLNLIVRVLGVRLFFSAYNSVQLAYVQKNMMFKSYFFASLAGAIVSAIVGIILAINGAGVWALVGQNLTLTIVTTIFLFMIIEWKPRLECSADSIKSMWSYASKMMLSTITYTLKDNIRSLVIGKYFSSEDLAFYNQGKKYPALLVTDIVDSMGKVLFPVMSNQQGAYNENLRLMRASIRTSSFILLPLILGLFAVSDTFIVILLTEKWIDAVPFMRILCLVYITRPMSTVFQKAILAIGRGINNLYHELITSILTLLLIVVAVLRDNVELIAWSYVIVAILGTMYFGMVVRKHFQYTFFNMARDFLPYLFLASIMSVCVFLLGKLQISVLLKLCLQISLGIIVYMLLSKILKIEELNYIINVIKKYKKS